MVDLVKEQSGLKALDVGVHEVQAGVAKVPDVVDQTGPEIIDNDADLNVGTAKQALAKVRTDKAAAASNKYTSHRNLGKILCRNADL